MGSTLACACEKLTKLKSFLSTYFNLLIKQIMLLLVNLWELAGRVGDFLKLS